MNQNISGSSLGSIHAHVDPRGSAGRFTEINAVCEQYGYPNKLMLVDSLAIKSSAGKHHLPNHPGDVISTTILQPWDIARVRNWINNCAEVGSFDIEVEQVIAAVSGSGELKLLAESQRIERLPSECMNLSLIPHKDTEFHSRIIVPKSDARFPVTEELLNETLAEGLELRSWYRFDRGDSWGYNSNQFADYQGVEKLVLHNHRLLLGYLRNRGFNYKPQTFLEAVLIICHS